LGGEKIEVLAERAVLLYPIASAYSFAVIVIINSQIVEKEILMYRSLFRVYVIISLIWVQE